LQSFFPDVVKTDQWVLRMCAGALIFGVGWFLRAERNEFYRRTFSLTGLVLKYKHIGPRCPEYPATLGFFLDEKPQYAVVTFFTEPKVGQECALGIESGTDRVCLLRKPLWSTLTNYLMFMGGGVLLLPQRWLRIYLEGLFWIGVLAVVVLAWARKVRKSDDAQLLFLQQTLTDAENQQQASALPEENN